MSRRRMREVSYMLDNDEISPEEAAFIVGYEEYIENY